MYQIFFRILRIEPIAKNEISIKRYDSVVQWMANSEGERPKYHRVMIDYLRSLRTKKMFQI